MREPITLVMAIKRIKQIKMLGSFNNPIKSKCILSEYLITKRFFTLQGIDL